MRKRKARIIVSESGGTAGKDSATYKISLPNTWVQKLVASDREVEISFDGEKITIEKKQTADSFVNAHREHKLKKYSYYFGNELCTVIYADHTDKVLFAENFTDELFKTAFGRNLYPTWDDLCGFIEERCIPRGRNGLREYLEAIGVYEYDPFVIIGKTYGRMAEDKQWIKTEDI